MKALVSILISAALIAPALAASVTAENGNIVVIDDAGKRRQITSGGQDSEPVMSPDGKLVAFTRIGAASKALEMCSADGSPVPAAALWTVKIDGSGARQLVTAQAADDMQKNVCDFMNKQFDTGGSRIFYETRAWTTSNAIRSVDVKSGKDAFFVPGNSLWVVTCAGSQYRDHVIASQHRYFVLGGSYDWFWMFDPSGKEIGPLGEEPPSTAELCEE